MKELLQEADSCVELLKKSELFSNLLDDDLMYASLHTSRILLKEGELLFSQAEQANRFYIIESGEIVIRDAGNLEDIARFTKGDVIGDFDFATGAVYDSNALASKDTILVLFPSLKKSMDDLALEKPDTSARILLRSLAMISHRIRSAQKIISENSPWIRELRKQIYTDSSSGLYSIAWFTEELPSLKTDKTALIYIKPDRFKELNDAYGHSAGDEIMQKISGILRTTCAKYPNAWPVRLRSNETTLIISGINEIDAFTEAQNLQDLFGEIQLKSAYKGMPFKMSASMVVAFWPNSNVKWKDLCDSAYKKLLKIWQETGEKIQFLEKSEK